MSYRKLLTANQDAKTRKGTKRGFLTGILYLAPSDVANDPDEARTVNVCPFATEGCRAACLYTAGRGKMTVVQKARISKTRYFAEDRAAFMVDLYKSVRWILRRAERLDLDPVVRLNGTSDISWERIRFTFEGRQYANIMDAFPSVTFYDYTKNPHRAALPDNYHLTFSLAEDNESEALAAIGNGMNVAVVFDVPKGDPLPASWTLVSPSTGARSRLRVVDGDKDDLRFLDPFPCFVGLRAKGDARGDDSGFVKLPVL